VLPTSSTRVQSCSVSPFSDLENELTIPKFIPKSSLKAILYDMDGTLAHTDPFHFQVWYDTLKLYGFDIDETFYKTRISGRLNPAIVADLLPHLSAAAAETLIRDKEAQFRALAPDLRRLAGLSDLLHWAQSHNLRQAVVTNAPPENVHHMLDALHLQTTFEVVVISDELGIGKPDPAPYCHALERLGIPADAAIAFEDSPSGIRSAVGAGIATVGVATTQTPDSLYSVGACLVIPDFTAPELGSVLTQPDETEA
jgi:HAD superfamily hydrolase (TIGR01509 family)